MLFLQNQRGIQIKNLLDKKYTPDAINKILNKAAKIAEINIHIGTHSLRKTFGYHHYKKFGNLPLLQKILNHSSSAVTLRYIGLEQEIIDESYNNFYL